MVNGIHIRRFVLTTFSSKLATINVKYYAQHYFSNRVDILIIFYLQKGSASLHIVKWDTIREPHIVVVSVAPILLAFMF